MGRQKSEIVRGQTGLRLRMEILLALKHLSVDLRKPMNLLVEEAAEEFLKKYGKKFE